MTIIHSYSLSSLLGKNYWIYFHRLHGDKKKTNQVFVSFLQQNLMKRKWNIVEVNLTINGSKFCVENISKGMNNKY